MAEVENIPVGVILAELVRRRDTLQRELSEVNDQVAACEIVISKFRSRRAGAVSPPPGMRVPMTADRLRGMTVKDALIAFAENNGGELITYEVRPLLVEAGILNGSSKNMSSHLHTTLARSDRFESLDGRGRWRLLPVKPDIAPRRRPMRRITFGESSTHESST